ncbi:flippase-like domain-containing protein [Bacteroidales bacterium OttesenSCG-928-K03]|nr:flippase-like domain-containing protein [Odoribacter sp. OttesenSCG-928-L07]MDL2239361.1 flippase-like domain-containing protein [Bacteroidales bacterium OttesenSCG-928-L14]MDL2240576.1 flippase-like domain-containing protein [Bacteroidales bacterium OttesenSCG-928-K22]MDL2242363.1 flippase-like domain-containing protein [Bacteroidales bacterium OttesenSCG-928-K03]
MKKKLFKDILKFIFFIGIGILLIWLFVRKLTPQEIEEIKLSLQNVKYIWLIVALLFAVLSNVARTSRWIILIEPLGYKMKYFNVFLSVLVAYFANLAIPRLGEVTRCGLLTKYEKIPFEKSFGTVITERVFDMLMFLLLFVVNLIWQFDLLKDYLNNRIFASFNETSSISGFALLVIIGIVVCLIVLFVFLFLKKRYPDNKIIVKITSLFLGFWDGIKSLIYIKRPWQFIFHTVLLWTCYFFMTYFVFFALPETSHLGVNAAMSSLVFSTIGIILVQGGIGIYPMIVSEVLVIYGISSAIGYASGWLIWLNQTVMVIFGGIVALILLPLINNKKHEKPQTTTENC